MWYRITRNGEILKKYKNSKNLSRNKKKLLNVSKMFCQVQNVLNVADGQGITEGWGNKL